MRLLDAYPIDFADHNIEFFSLVLSFPSPFPAEVLTKLYSPTDANQQHACVPQDNEERFRLHLLAAGNKDEATILPILQHVLPLHHRDPQAKFSSFLRRFINYIGDGVDDGTLRGLRKAPEWFKECEVTPALAFEAFNCASKCTCKTRDMGEMAKLMGVLLEDARFTTSRGRWRLRGCFTA
eukprot:comp24285_c0_seq1/m.45397 comp24285_c0_seq1/g.45397  ORF comp24285_c0_seq1/g.45397 comp24285_c0_seq1/m.45397 type:complete len:181 (-) comp24285_c0_seq1:1080-1622(-)